MLSILRRLLMSPKTVLDALFQPANDPRQVFQSPYRRPLEPGGQVHRGQVPACGKIIHGGGVVPTGGLRQVEGPARRALHGGFSNINSSEGLKALQELANEYERLQRVLGRHRETDPLAIAHIPALAQGTYHQGLSVLEDALELLRVISSSDGARLESEVVELERDLESLRRDRAQEARVKIREETLASHRERLAMLVQQQFRVDELLHQSYRCEASLHRARMELATIKTAGSEGSVSVVTETLRRTIAQAKEVRGELEKYGF